MMQFGPYHLGAGGAGGSSQAGGGGGGLLSRQRPLRLRLIAWLGLEAAAEGDRSGLAAKAHVEKLD
jgi:hypothetical protein